MSKICPKCGGIAEFNAYYGRITCTRCAWVSEKITNKNSKKYALKKTKSINKNKEEESATRKIMKTWKCNSGSEFLCKYKTSEGACSLPSYQFCIMKGQEYAFGVGNYVEPDPPLVGVTPTEELKPQVIMGKRNEAPVVAAGVGVKVGSDDKNKIKICCDEITLTKDSVGIEVNIQNLIQNIDKFETIEINGRVFRRVKDEND